MEPSNPTGLWAKGCVRLRWFVHNKYWVCSLLSFSCMFVHSIWNKRTHSCTTFTHIVQGFFGSVNSANFLTDAARILFNHKNCITALTSVLLGVFLTKSIISPTQRNSISELWILLLATAQRRPTFFVSTRMVTLSPPTPQLIESNRRLLSKQSLYLLHILTLHIIQPHTTDVTTCLTLANARIYCQNRHLI